MRMSCSWKAAEAGADDVQFADEMAEIFIDLDDFQGVRDHLKSAGYQMAEANMIYDPNNPVELGMAESLQVMRFLEAVEDVDDVQNIYSTLDISDEAIVAMEA